MIINDRSTYDLYGTPLDPDEEDAVMASNTYRAKLSTVSRGLLPYRDRLRLLGGGGDYVPRESSGAAAPHPLSPEERSAIAEAAWVTRHAHGEHAEISGPAARTRFHELDVQWAHANNRLMEVLHEPQSPAYHESLEELKGIVKEINRLRIDTGGLEEVGQPGGPRDVVVIGAGPAGMQAAIMAGMDGLDSLLVDTSTTPGGQPKTSSRIENYYGFPAGVTGKDLADGGYTQVQRLGSDTRLGVTVTGMTYDPQTGLKTVTLSTGETILTRTVILAGGIKYRELKFEGADNPHINYGDGERLLLDGAGKDVLVVGGSNGAAQAAIGAARTAKHVTVLARTSIDEMSKKPKLGVEYHPSDKIDVVEGDEIAKVITDNQGRPKSVLTKNGRTIPAGAIAIYAGGVAETGWLPASIARSTKEKKVMTDSNLETAIPGVFAAGDLRDGSLPRIASSVGEGARAEKGLFDYFRKLAAKKIEQALPVSPTPSTIH